MYILIILTSLSTKFYFDIDTKVISGLRSESHCLSLGKKLSADIKLLNSDMETKIYCEEGK